MDCSHRTHRCLSGQANLFANVAIKHDYKTYIDYSYSGVVELMGGKRKVIHRLSSAMDHQSLTGVTILDATIGSLGKFYKSGNETHCLLPETVTWTTPVDRAARQKNSYQINLPAENMQYY